MTQRYVCIHGHFYQPPRENAWLEAIEIQDSAHPYHDWNQRITAECYAANAVSRILDGDGYIIDIVNNYSRMSFNFGPTLLSWMEEKAPAVYESIIAADQASALRFDGHGSAIAQAFNHMIMPLANRRDKETQIRWGIQDFRHRFGRDPKGMWLPETAVDLESLEIMAACGIEFTLLSPTQAQGVLAAGASQWWDVSNGSIDSNRVYRIALPSNQTMALFFYHGELSHAVAFEQLPSNGDHFFERLMSGFDPASDAPQLVHICSDGETYGHHHYQGDMGLAYTLQRLEEDPDVRLTNYGAFLAAHPPEYEVSIKENTSWSCFHGVERWRSDCGCNSNVKSHWHQKWRRPLREALDELRDQLAVKFENTLNLHFKDAWRARDDYIEVVLQRNEETIEHFLRRHSRAALSPPNQTAVLKLLEMQRYCMLMYTSCGWFFDELSGLETVQIIQYAGRVLQLAASLFQDDLEGSFLKKLSQAPSNIAEHRDGERIYAKWVRPAAVSLADVGAHFAISSLFRDYPEKSDHYCFTAIRKAYHFAEAGRAKLGLGRAVISSRVTWESAEFYFAVLHFGDHNISCGLGHNGNGSTFQTLREDITAAFERADFPLVVQKLDKYFNSYLYSMKSLFRDDQRKILEPILREREDDAISVYRAIYSPNVPLMRFLTSTNSLPPKALTVAGELVLNHTLKHELGREDLDHPKIQELMEQAQLARIPLNEATLEFTLRENIERQVRMFEEDPARYEVLDALTTAVELVYDLPFHVMLRQVQNTHFKVARKFRVQYMDRVGQGDREAARWLKRFDQLGEKLLIRPYIG